MANQLCVVSADHIAEQYRADRKVVRIHEWKGRFSATASPYGSGKEFATVDEAVRSLLGDNGCTNIRILERGDEFGW